MKKLVVTIGVAAALSAATALTGCTDEIVQPKRENQLLSRAPYDYNYVEWDNVESLNAAYNGENPLKLPWASGSSASGSGVPSSWIDRQLRDPNPKNRAYSRENGWVMAFHNLRDNLEKRKYFGLYNKHTGVLRVFFYEISSSSGVGTSSAFLGLRIAGSSSLLNFTGQYANAMSIRDTNPMFFTTPVCNISNTSESGSTYNVSGNPGYKADTWYGFEVELAYDANATADNTIELRLWGQYLTNINLTGSSEGNISGTINTVYHNSPQGVSISLNNVDFSTNKVTTTFNPTKDGVVKELENKISKGGNFVSRLWNRVKSQVPGLIDKGINEALNSFISGGISSGADALSRLLSSITGKSDSPMTSTSKVDLGIKTTMELSGTGSTNVVGWGGVSAFSLPQFASPNNLFSGKLGVWNLADNPTVYVDMSVKELYYPRELVPNPERPVAYRPDFTFNLASVTPTINPDVLSDFKLENVSRQIVYDNYIYTDSHLKPSGEEYGMTETDQFYKPKGSYTTFSVSGMAMNFKWMPGDISPETRYNFCWDEMKTLANYIKCHIYFELVSKTDPTRRYAFAKYFPVKAVKRNFSCKEETITE